MSHRFLEVDVFGSGPFTGNPLAVVAHAGDLTGGQMQEIARWLGLSETTFLLPATSAEADYRVRIFTPEKEYPFAGHPTLGSARAWIALGGTPRAGRVVQECGAGLVEVRIDANTYSFATPPRTKSEPLSATELDKACTVLGVDPSEVVAHAWGVNGPRWQLIQLRDAAAVHAIEPRPTPATRLGLVGLYPAGGPVAYEVRALSGCREDPVTGSLQGVLAQWMRERRQVPAEYVASQGERTGARGRVDVCDDGVDIWVGGTAEVRVCGELEV